MQFIRDMVFVKSVERQLGRSLTEEEISSDDFKVTFPDGHIEWIQIPLLCFPHDLMTKPEDFYQPEVIYLKDAA